MGKRLIVLMLLLLCLGGIVSAQAFVDFSADAVLYVDGTTQAGYSGQIWAVNDSGVRQVIQIPTGIADAFASSYSSVLVSPDLRFVVLQRYLNSGGISVKIYDAVRDLCCFDITNVVPNAEAFAFGDFEPNGTRFAVSYVSVNPNSERYAEGGILVIDATTGMVTQSITMDAINQQLGTPDFGVWAGLGAWTANGIEFVPNCYACDGGAFEGTYHLYNPDTNAVINEGGSSFTMIGEHLASTNEFIYPYQDRRYRYSPEPSAYWGIPNIVYYFANGLPATEFAIVFSENPLAAPVAYAQSDMVNVRNLIWVGDGSAFLVEGANTTFWDIVYRGNTTPTRINRGDTQALVGMRSGWLASQPGLNGSDNLMFYDMATMSGTIFATFPVNSRVTVVRAPELGGSIQAAPFVNVPPPTEPFALCDGFLPNRLVTGEIARVTPGAPNNIRQSPTSNSELLGAIPGSAEFRVINGPMCDTDNGIAWWYVSYNGIEGWTAEGQGDTYWTEPLP